MQIVRQEGTARERGRGRAASTMGRVPGLVYVSARFLFLLYVCACGFGKCWPGDIYNILLSTGTLSIYMNQEHSQLMALSLTDVQRGTGADLTAAATRKSLARGHRL